MREIGRDAFEGIKEAATGYIEEGQGRDQVFHRMHRGGEPMTPDVQENRKRRWVFWSGIVAFSITLGLLLFWPVNGEELLDPWMF